VRHHEVGHGVQRRADGGQIVGVGRHARGPCTPLLRPRPRRSGAMILTCGSASASNSHARCDEVTPWTARIVGAPGSASHTPTSANRRGRRHRPHARGCSSRRPPAVHRVAGAGHHAGVVDASHPASEATSSARSGA
jgi:hypothetical protein